MTHGAMLFSKLIPKAISSDDGIEADIVSVHSVRRINLQECRSGSARVAHSLASRQRVGGTGSHVCAIHESHSVEPDVIGGGTDVGEYLFAHHLGM